MKIKFSKNSDTEVEYTTAGEVNAPKKFRILNVFIFIFCLALAFVFWCYALYVEDPIIEKNITVNFILINAESGEYLDTQSKNITVYGEQSILGNVNSINVKIDRKEFAKYDTKTLVNLQYPKKISSKTQQLYLTLHTKND